MRTHSLETAEGVTRQDTERNRPIEAHSPPGDGSDQRDLSGHGKKPTDRGALTSWRRQRPEGLVRTGQEIDQTTERGTLTNSRRQREGLVRAQQEPDQTTERGTLTNSRQQREGLVRTRKEIDQARRTHFLETAEEGLVRT